MTDPLEIRPSTIVCYLAKLGRSVSNDAIVIMEICRKNFTPRLPRSLKVIETDSDRSVAYDFLLVIHSNHGPIS